MSNVNAALRSLFNDLVEKRLWPVAAALGIALVAIPVLLSKSAENEPAATPAPAAAPATGSGGALSAFLPVVNTEGKKSSEIRKILKGFRSKDPFKVHGLGGGGSSSGSTTVESPAPQAGSGTDTGSVTPPGSTSGSGDQGQGTSGSGDQGQGTSGSGDQGQGTSGSGSPTVTYFRLTVDVRFGKADNLDKKRLEPFRALPSSQDPVVVFMGVRTDRKTAVFLVSSATSTTGEGDCEPNDTCTFLLMKPGDKQSFETVDGNNQVITLVLKLLDVNIEKTKAPQASKSSRRAANRAARKRHSRPARRIQAIGF